MPSLRRSRTILYFLTVTCFYCQFFWIYKKSRLSENSVIDPSMTLNAGMIVDTTNVTVLKLPVVHVFLVSAYYYPTSKSLGPNAVALNMVVDSKSLNIDNATYSVVGSNSTHRVISNAPSQVEGVPNCRYTTAMASTNTVSNLAKLEMESTGMTVEIPFKIARYSAPRPVIICISPQFVAEQWQIFMMQVHVSHRFGGHLHIYLTSIIDSYFELMKKYELLGFITIDYWLRMKFSKTETPFFEPNGNVEWRNQAGAQIDCLLQYKEAAEYIAFFDMDDILFPKTYPRYIEEFQAEWSVDPTTENFSEFNFPDLVTSLRSSSTVKRGKVVVRPDRYNSTWIHYSWHDLNSRIIASPNLIHVQRPTQKHGDNKMLIKWKMEFGPLNETIKSVDIAAIQKEIEKIRNSTIHPDITSRLPTSDFYLPIVFECYYKSFYGAAFDNQPGGFLCPNADSCELPQRENFKCIHSDAEYHSGPHMVPYTFHYAKKPFWSSSVGCYQ